MPARTTSKLMSRPNLEKRLRRLLRELEECRETVDSPRFANRCSPHPSAWGLRGCFSNAAAFLGYAIEAVESPPPTP